MDVTERKKAESELHEAHRTLEERVKIRTAELEAEAAAWKKTEQELRVAERRYSALFANKINGMAHCRIITDEHGRPVDYVSCKSMKHTNGSSGSRRRTSKAVESRKYFRVSKITRLIISASTARSRWRVARHSTSRFLRIHN